MENNPTKNEKPKRKYVRKPKKTEKMEVQVPPVIPVAPVIPVQEHTTEMTEMPPLERMSVDEVQYSLEEVMKEMVKVGYNKVHLYIYYKSATFYDFFNTVKFIKKFQEHLDKYRIGTQVVISYDPKFKKFLPNINNCFTPEIEPRHWTDLCLDNDTQLALRIKKFPAMYPDELYEKIKSLTSYEDGIFELVQLK